MNQNHRFGIEIEFNTNAHQHEVVNVLTAQGLQAGDSGRTANLPDAWTVKYDGSIGSGWEIVSPILSPANLRSEVTRVGSALNALKASGRTVRAGERCGLHVHVSGFGEQDVRILRNVTRRFCNFEDTFDLFQPRSRRANTYCRSNIRTFGAGDVAFQRMWEATDAATTTSDLVRIVSPTRYMKMNLQSLLRHGTVEFRQHSATVNADKILHWVGFLSSFVDVSGEATRVWKRKPGPQAQPERFRKLMRGVPGDVMGYMTQRLLQQNGGHFPA